MSFRKKTGLEQEVLESLPEPQASAGEHVVCVLKPLGNTNFEVSQANGEIYVCRLNSKFKNYFYVKRGDYVIAKRYDQSQTNHTPADSRVRAEITHLLYKDQIKHLKKINLWPKEFVTDRYVQLDIIEADKEDDEEEDDDDEGEEYEDDEQLSEDSLSETCDSDSRETQSDDLE